MSTTTLQPKAAPGNAAPTKVREARPMRDAIRRYLSNPLALYGVIYTTLILLVAIFAPLLTPYTYDAINPGNALANPSWEHPMGTDVLGRDMMTRIFYAARPMLLVGLVTQFMGLLIGVPLGIMAGYLGGFVDWLVTRLVDMFSALPWYLIVLYMVMVLSPSLQNLIIALTITSWVGSCRIVRGLTLSIREQEYINAARALGIPTARILLRHVLPQAAPLLIWSFAAGIPQAVFAEAGLSFLGMGIRPPQPSWGQMLAEAGGYWQYWPHMFLFPSVMITLSVLAFQGMADGLREALDVKVKTR